MIHVIALYFAWYPPQFSPALYIYRKLIPQSAWCTRELESAGHQHRSYNMRCFRKDPDQNLISVRDRMPKPADTLYSTTADEVAGRGGTRTFHASRRVHNAVYYAVEESILNA